jgi:hypothetical protein
VIPPEPLICAECGREPRDDENAADEWCCYSDGAGELVTFCPECAEREFARRTFEHSGLRDVTKFLLYDQVRQTWGKYREIGTGSKEWGRSGESAQSVRSA